MSFRRKHPLFFLLLVLVACLPPMVIDLGVRLPTHSMECIALTTSQEAWLRWHDGEEGAWLVTSNDFQPRFQKPPLLAWLHFLSWSDLPPGEASAEQLTSRARWVSVAAGMLMIGGIFWIGCTLADAPLAALAALIAGSMVFLQRQARVASYDIHAAAWATIAVAAALWAMRSRSAMAGLTRGGVEGHSDGAAAGGRFRGQTAGWVIAGIAVACSAMSKNPLSLVLMTLPVAGAIWMMPANRGANIRGLLLAIVVGIGLILPWYVYVAVEYKNADDILKYEFTQPRADDPQPVFYYLGLFGLVLPWTVWLICGLVQPFKLGDMASKRRALAVLAWFAVIFVFFSIWPAKQQRYILPIVAPAALLMAWFFHEQGKLAALGSRDGLLKVLGHLHWAALTIASIALGPLLAAHEIFQWVRREQWRPPIAELDGLTAGAVVAGLAAIAIAGWRWQARWDFMRSAAATAAWSLLATTVFWYAYAHAPTEVAQLRAEAARVAELIGPAPLRSLRMPHEPSMKGFVLNREFRFFHGRLVRPIRPKELKAYAESAGGPAYVLAANQEACSDAMRDAGFEKVGDVKTDFYETQHLWLRDEGSAQRR